MSILLKISIRQTLLLLLLIHTTVTRSQTPVYKNYTVNDGLPSQVVYCALQDKQGYMWFGTDAGVSQFDGKHFKNFTSKDGLSDNEVLNMFMDSKGKLWFYTLNGKLSYYYRGKFYNPSNDHLLSKINIKYEFMSFLEDSNGNLWLGAYGRQVVLITRMDEVVIFDLEYKDTSYRRAWVYCLEKNPNEIFLITHNAIWKYKENKMLLLDSVNYFEPMKTNFNLFKANRKLYYYYSEKGIMSTDSGVTNLIINRNKIVDYNEMNGLFIDSQENIWIYTKQYKTICFEKKNGDYQMPKTFFNGLEVGKILVDYEGNRWFCSTGNGIFMQKSGISSDGAEFISTFPETNDVSAMTFDHNNNLWFGSSLGRLNCLKNGLLSSFYLKNVNKVTSISFDSDSNLWYTVNNGVRLIKKEGLSNPTLNSKVIEFEYEPGKFGSLYGSKQIAIDNNENVYISRNSGLTRAITSGNKIYLTYWTPNTLFSKRIYCMYFDYMNNLWFNNFEKLYCYTSEKEVLSFSELNDDFLGQINDIKGNLDSSIIIATYGGGLKFFKNGKIINQLNMAGGLAGDLCRKVFVDSNIVYVATNQGFTYFNYVHNRITDIKTITTSDGIVSNDIKDICAKGKKIFLATSAGLCIVNKDITQLSSDPPPVYITSINANGTSITDFKNLKLLYHSGLSVNYIAITFVQPEKVSYQYKITGNDKEWIESKNSSITFSTLPPGDYTFELRAKKYNSEWSQPSFMSFTIIPPIWKQWWFRIYLLYVFSMLVYYTLKFYSNRNYSLQLRSLKNEQVLADERNRIAADMHDDLGADLSNLLMMSRSNDREAAQNPTGKTTLLKTEEFAAGLAGKVDEIIWALNSENDTLHGLIHFIHDYSMNLSKISGLSNDLNFPIVISDLNISAAFRRNIFLVIKESLNNIVRHAEATQFAIEIQLTPSTIRILIRDNGKGFNILKLSRTGDGITNMNKRLRTIAGTCQINSSPGNGTTIIINAPLV